MTLRHLLPDTQSRPFATYTHDELQAERNWYEQAIAAARALPCTQDNVCEINRHLMRLGEVEEEHKRRRQ